MRTDSPHSGNDLHWHNGSTCHGSSTLAACAEEAIRNGWVGKILEKEDLNEAGKMVKCYSLIAGSFETHGKLGKYVAEIVLAVKPL